MNGIDDVEEQKSLACRRLVARAAFAYWYPDLPRLPLAADERHELKQRHGVGYIVAQYSVSVGDRDNPWHPSFERYACGVMASPLTPPFIKNDPELLRQYPPYPLPGLGPGLVWNPPKVPS
jgi:hypothetical protein